MKVTVSNLDIAYDEGNKTYNMQMTFILVEVSVYITSLSYVKYKYALTLLYQLIVPRWMSKLVLS